MLRIAISISSQHGSLAMYFVLVLSLALVAAAPASARYLRPARLTTTTTASSHSRVPHAGRIESLLPRPRFQAAKVLAPRLKWALWGRVPHKRVPGVERLAMPTGGRTLFAAVASTQPSPRGSLLPNAKGRGIEGCRASSKGEATSHSPCPLVKLCPSLDPSSTMASKMEKALGTTTTTTTNYAHPTRARHWWTRGYEEMKTYHRAYLIFGFLSYIGVRAQPHPNTRTHAHARTFPPRRWSSAGTQA